METLGEWGSPFPIRPEAEMTRLCIPELSYCNRLAGGGDGKLQKGGLSWFAGAGSKAVDKINCLYSYLEKTAWAASNSARMVSRLVSDRGVISQGKSRGPC